MFNVDLSRSDFIRISGDDAVSFLQGQVSCDMNQLRSDNSLRGALCNLKGRVLADFRITREGNGCLLQTQAGMGETVLQTLGRYAVFSKVDLEPETDFRCAFGLFGDDAAEALSAHWQSLPEAADGVTRTDSALLIRASGATPRYEVWCRSPEELSALLSGQAGIQAELQDWRRQEFLAGEIHVSPEMSGNYTPQLLNYDLSGVINFRKGCYTGQEVVARMYFRSQAKKRLYLLSSDGRVDKSVELLQHWGERSQKAEILGLATGTINRQDRQLILALLATEGVAAGCRLEVSGGSQQIELLSLPYLTQATTGAST